MAVWVGSNNEPTPAYIPAATDDATAGQQVFTTFCARCHGVNGKVVEAPGAQRGSLIDPTYLALISNACLRSIIVVGQPEQGMPGWRGDGSRPLTGAEITNFVTWVAAQDRHARPDVCAAPLTTHGDTRMSELLKHPGESSNDGLSPEGEAAAHSRRRFLFKVAMGLNGLVGLALAVPIIGYLTGPALQKDSDTGSWIPLGPISNFSVGKTTLVDFVSPVKTLAMARPGRSHAGFAASPASSSRCSRSTALTLAVLCGGLRSQSYFFVLVTGARTTKPGERAAGPPERGLCKYRHRIDGEALMIHAGDMHTLATHACIEKPLSRSAQQGRTRGTHGKLEGSRHRHCRRNLLVGGVSPRSRPAADYSGRASNAVEQCKLVVCLWQRRNRAAHPSGCYRHPARARVRTNGERCLEQLATAQSQLPLGWYLRAIHGWGSDFMVAIVLIHMTKVFLFGASKFPRELNWIFGVALLLLTLGMALPGRSCALIRMHTGASASAPPSRVVSHPRCSPDVPHPWRTHHRRCDANTILRATCLHRSQPAVLVSRRTRLALALSRRERLAHAGQTCAQDHIRAEI